MCNFLASHFLAGHMSDWITGEVMDVNGGQHMD